MSGSNILATRASASKLAQDHINNLALQEGIKASVHGGGSFTRLGNDRISLISQRIDGLLFPPDTSSPTPPPPLPPPAPPHLDRIDIDAPNIVFGNGVPVGGTAHLTLFPNGAYSFSGHFHDSGATSYDMEMVIVIKSSANTVFTFAHKGRVHGTFESGSRNDDWGDSSTNPALAAAWADLSAGNTWHWSTAANFDFGALIDQAVKTLGQVAAVIAIVA